MLDDRRREYLRHMVEWIVVIAIGVFLGGAGLVALIIILGRGFGI